MSRLPNVRIRRLLRTSAPTSLGCIALQLLLVLCLGCGRETGDQQKGATARKERPTARIGYVPIAVALPLFVAVDKGYFNDAGVSVERVRINTSNDLGTAGTLGRVDFMMPCALNVIFDIANASGVKHRLFGLNVYSDQPPHVADFLLVSTHSSIRRMTDLRGKRISGHPGSATQIMIKLIMEKEGLGQSDYSFVPLQPAEWGPALSSGSVDAVAALEPQASQLLADGTARSIVDGFYAKLMPDIPLSGWWVSAKVFERKDPHALVDPVVSAYRRAVTYISEHPEEAKQHFKNYVPIRDDVLPHMQLNRWLVPENLEIQRVQRMADIFSENHVIKSPVRIDDFLLK